MSLSALLRTSCAIATAALLAGEARGAPKGLDPGDAALHLRAAAQEMLEDPGTVVTPPRVSAHKKVVWFHLGVIEPSVQTHNAALDSGLYPLVIAQGYVELVRKRARASKWRSKIWTVGIRTAEAHIGQGLRDPRQARARAYKAFDALYAHLVSDVRRRGFSGKPLPKTRDKARRVIGRTKPKDPRVRSASDAAAPVTIDGTTPIGGKVYGILLFTRALLLARGEDPVPHMQLLPMGKKQALLEGNYYLRVVWPRSRRVRPWEGTRKLPLGRGESTTVGYSTR